MIDLTIDHGKFDDKNPAADAEQILYRFRSFEVEPEDNTCEPTIHLKRQKMLSNYRGRNLTSPTYNDRAITGL